MLGASSTTSGSTRTSSRSRTSSPSGGCWMSTARHPEPGGRAGRGGARRPVLVQVAPSSTRCSSGRSPTPTATVSATCDGLTEQAGLPRLAGRGLPVAAAVLHLTAARRRLRRRRPTPACCRSSAPSTTSGCFLQAAHEPGHPRHHRHRHEPHLRPAPVVPGLAAATRTARTATSTCGRTPTTAVLRARASSSSTPSSPTGPTTRCASSTSGTGSSATSPISTSTTRQVQEAILRSAAGSGCDLGIDGFRLDAVPYLFEREGHELREPPRDARLPQEGAQGLVDDAVPRHGCCSCEANQWPADVVEYFGVTKDPDTGGLAGSECHMCVPLPRDAAHLHGRPARVALPHLGDPGADPGDPRRTASGGSSCATTTS